MFRLSLNKVERRANRKSWLGDHSITWNNDQVEIMLSNGYAKKFIKKYEEKRREEYMYLQ